MNRRTVVPTGLASSTTSTDASSLARYEPNTLSGKLKRAAPALRKVGIYIIKRHSGDRAIVIEKRAGGRAGGQGARLAEAAFMKVPAGQ